MSNGIAVKKRGGDVLISQLYIMIVTINNLFRTKLTLQNIRMSHTNINDIRQFKKIFLLLPST